MHLLSQLGRCVHGLQHNLQFPWRLPHVPEGPPGGGVVLTVTLLSVAAAAMLVLAP